MPTPDHEMDPARKAALLTGAGMWETSGSEEAGIRALPLTDGPHGVRLAAPCARGCQWGPGRECPGCAGRFAVC